MKTAEKALELYRELNGNHAEIARRLGVSRQRIGQILKPLGLGGTHAPTDDTIAARKEQLEQAKLFRDNRKKASREEKIAMLRKLYVQHGGIYMKMQEALNNRLNISQTIDRLGLKEEMPSLAKTGPKN